MQQIEISEMSMADYDAVRLLLATPGLTLRTADSPDATERYLKRNPGLSFVAKSEGRVIGCVMCGHDGRRGYLQHLAVDPVFRRRGIGRMLVERCLAALQTEGIDKTHLDVLAGNSLAEAYWTRLGWKRRDDIIRFSFTSSNDPNA